MVIELKELQVIAGEKGFDLETMVKDYYLTLLLYKLSFVKGLYFKGGTALNKIYFNHVRLSEDLDFSVKGNIQEIEAKIRQAVQEEKSFTKITHDKKTSQFVRLLVHYASPFKDDYVIVDLNQRASIHLKPEEKEVRHFYAGKIPEFSVQTLNFKEIIAEKVSAAIQRNAPRDYYDLYNIILKKIPISIKLVKQKLKEHNQEFDVNKIFKHGSKVFSRWETDLLPLTTTKPGYKKVIAEIAKYFKYKQAKKSKRQRK
ncbi:nucleotidyl transferase AbiEii/AbiGii toxin family protein [Candidatus Micrarchaeota archaeon]|nr:nucleotidyl transferase AbiEii/AbiGii toxin family protein [Candidatus Micrarchaeota archaeon]